MAKPPTDDERKGYRYGKSGSYTVLEEYDEEAEGWYTMATLHEPDETRTGERLVTALTTLDAKSEQSRQLAAVVEALKEFANRHHNAHTETTGWSLEECHNGFCEQASALLADLPTAGAKLRCIDCDRLLTGVHYGAGTGDGQRFRCERCHHSRERAEKLVEALRKYGTHASGCLAHGWKRGDNEYRCNCGLDAALRGGGVISISTQTICMACCAAVGTHYCGLAWCTHRLCKGKS